MNWNVKTVCWKANGVRSPSECRTVSRALSFSYSCISLLHFQAEARGRYNVAAVDQGHHRHVRGSLEKIPAKSVSRQHTRHGSSRRFDPCRRLRRLALELYVHCARIVHNVDKWEGDVQIRHIDGIILYNFLSLFSKSHSSFSFVD